MATKFAQIKAIEKKNKEKLLSINSALTDNSGIYFLTRNDEDGFKFAYIGQAKHILTRLAQHLVGYQHIDLSLKSHGFFNVDNRYGWRVGFLEYPESQLDEMEQYWIKRYADDGYQLRNKTSGSQGKGKRQIAEYRPSKGYRDGINQGTINCSKEIAYLFDKHLVVSTKNQPPTVNQQKALNKFSEFLELYKQG